MVIEVTAAFEVGKGSPTVGGGVQEICEMGHLKLDLEANSKANIKIQRMDLALGPPIPNPRPGSGPIPSIQIYPNIIDVKLGIALCCHNLVHKIGI